MSHQFEDEDEEEDELQRILEGRDVEESDNEEQYESTHDVDYEDNNESVGHYNHKHKNEVKKSRSHETNSRHYSKTIIKERKQINLSKNRVSNVSEENNYDFEMDLDLNENNANEENSDINDEKRDENKTKVEVKVRRMVSKPQPKLNADRLMTKTGIAELPKLFENVKFGGRGHELNDLNKIMFKLEHWSHRLFPSLTFDDFIEKVEQLGNKRPLKTFVSKMRYDLPLNLDPEEDVVDIQSDDELQANADNNTIFDSVSAFDAIVAKQNENVNIDTNEREVISDSQTNNSEEEIETYNVDKEKVDLEITNRDEEMNDALSEDEVIRQLNSNDDQIQ